MKAKYIITKDEDIIIFSARLKHSDFFDFKPIRAGFIAIGVDKQGSLTFDCFGESVSLRLKSSPEKDNVIAERQILGIQF